MNQTDSQFFKGADSEFKNIIFCDKPFWDFFIVIWNIKVNVWQPKGDKLTYVQLFKRRQCRQWARDPSAILKGIVILIGNNTRIRETFYLPVNIFHIPVEIHIIHGIIIYFSYKLFIPCNQYKYNNNISISNRYVGT